MFVKFVKDDKTIEEVSISSEMIPFPTDIVVLEAEIYSGRMEGLGIV